MVISPLHKHIQEYAAINLLRDKIAFLDRMAEQYGRSRAYCKKFFMLHVAAMRIAEGGVKKKQKPEVTIKEQAEQDAAVLLSGLKSELGIGNDLNLPDSFEEVYQPFILPSSCRNILNISDIHLPFQSNQALSVTLKYGIAERVDTVLLNGDVMDFYAISRFEKEKSKRDLMREIRIGREFLYTLRKLFPSATILYKDGNHEDRWKHHLNTNHGDFVDIDDFQFRSVMRLEDNNIIQIGSKTVIHAGHLTILHGHELGKTLFSPVNPARGLYIRARASAIMGHCHQTSEHTGKDIRNKIITCWSQGCLSELNPDYAILNNYNHGFSHITMQEDGNFSLRNYRIMDGRII